MIVIVGAGGFLGNSLSCYISSLKINFATISRSFQWTPVPFEKRYISSASKVSDFISSLSDDLQILYMAGSPNLTLAEQDPLGDLTLHKNELSSFLSIILELESKCKRFVFVSSAGTVYGDSNGIRKTETSLLSPKSAYGRRNIELESVVQAWSGYSQVQTSVFRITNPFGPGQSRFRRRGLIQALIDSSFSEQKIFIRGDGHQIRDYIFSTDLCTAITCLLDLDSIPNIINIASGISYSARQIVDVLNNYQIFPSLEYINSAEFFEVNDSLVSCELLGSLLSMPEHKLRPFSSDNILSMYDVTQNDYEGF